MNDIVDLTTFHTDMRDLKQFMEVKERYITADYRPGPRLAPLLWVECRA
jgi:hypothetical protein